MVLLLVVRLLRVQALELPQRHVQAVVRLQPVAGQQEPTTPRRHQDMHPAPGRLLPREPGVEQVAARRVGGDHPALPPEEVLQGRRQLQRLVARPGEQEYVVRAEAPGQRGDLVEEAGVLAVAREPRVGRDEEDQHQAGRGQPERAQRRRPPRAAHDRGQRRPRAHRAVGHQQRGERQDQRHVAPQRVEVAALRVGASEEVERREGCHEAERRRGPLIEVA